DVPPATIGGGAATVVYAGWVADNVAGLYQVNVTLPANTSGTNFTTAAGTTLSSLTAPVQLPIVITANGVSSQAGVNVWVEPKLVVAPPTGNGLSGTVGVLWSTTVDSNNTPFVTASQGTSPYLYSV